MTTSDSALNALCVSLATADSALAASLAEILTDAIQELVEAVTPAAAAKLETTEDDLLADMTFPPAH